MYIYFNVDRTPGFIPKLRKLNKAFTHFSLFTIADFRGARDSKRSKSIESAARSRKGEADLFKSVNLETRSRSIRRFTEFAFSKNALT